MNFKLKFYSVVLVSVFSGCALAGTFDGIYGQLGLNYNLNKPKFIQNDQVAYSKDKGNFSGDLGVGYSHAIGKLNLAVNLFYRLGQETYVKSATIFPSLTGKTNLKAQDTYGISIKPGYYFSRDTLGYINISYLRTKFISAYKALDGTVTSSSQKMNGVGLGLGAKKMINENLYSFVEVNYIKYKTQESNLPVLGNFKSKPSYWGGTIGVGYTF